MLGIVFGKLKVLHLCFSDEMSYVFAYLGTLVNPVLDLLEVYHCKGAQYRHLCGEAPRPSTVFHSML